MHPNESCGWFVYAGFIFIGRSSLDKAKRKYINANKKIKEITGRTDEIKAWGLSNSHKRSLFNCMRSFESFSVAVEINRVRDNIINDKKSICRFKDYALKRGVKAKLEQLASTGAVDKTLKTLLHVNVDEQLTATDGYYDLRSSIYEELRYGIQNWNYGTTHPNLFDNDLEVNLQYCESKNNYMIQASDILANRIFVSYRDNRSDLRQISFHNHLILP